jgi:hypothetical protein
MSSYRRTRAASVAFVTGIALFTVAACASSGTSSAPTSSATSEAAHDGATDSAVRPPVTAAGAADMRGRRYCEVLLVTSPTGNASADVYNSYPLNDCPQARWQALDPKAIATAEGVPVAVLNGPRYWLMDKVEKAPGGVTMTKKDFGGIEMYRQANVEIGSIADAAKRYTPHEVNRSTTFTFDAGHTVYELTAPDGSVYVMQTWSQQVDPTLAEADLAALGTRLKLPEGWRYGSRTLAEPLRVVTTSTAAKVLQDDLANSYSLETAA